MHFATLIFKNVFARPSRSVLTILGLGVAIGTMIALLGISQNFDTSITETFEKRGFDLVVVPGGMVDQLSGKIDESIIEQVRQIPKVSWVEPALLEVIDMEQRDRKPGESTAPVMTVLMQAWPPANFDRAVSQTPKDLDLTDGRVLNAEDTGRGRLMLGSTLAANLGKKPGDKVILLGKPFEIVGLFKSFNVFETGSVLMLLSDAQADLDSKGKITGFSVSLQKGADREKEVEAVRQAILELKGKDGRQVRLSAEPPRKYIENASHLKLTRAMAWMVSSIAIVIGVISMLNTMIMSVMERTREIGILRAIGWPKRRIIAMVLGEASILGLLGALVGALGAIAVTYLLTFSPRVNGFIEAGIPLSAIGLGLAISLFIGLAGGVYPAIAAARLLPTEAIRHE